MSSTRPCAAAPPNNTSMALELHIYSAGNADAIALRLPDSKWAVIDCGLDDGHAFVDYLRERGCEALAFIVLTHPDADHYLGLHAVLEQFSEVDAFWMPDEWDRGKAALRDLLLHHIHPRVKLRRLRAHYARAKDRLYSLPGHRFDAIALSPVDHDRWMAHRALDQARLRARAAPSANRLSLVLLIRYGAVNLLLGSDAEISTWKVIADSLRETSSDEREAHIIKIPHHGSRDSWDASVMSILLRHDQFIAVVSAQGNRRTSPAREVLCELTDLGAEVYCTGRSLHCVPGWVPGTECCGHVQVTIDDGGGINTQTEGAGRQSGTGYCNIVYRKATQARC
ncbi:MAG TPA: MBL fold metallo-hydrolase [Anaerolineales bacterium]|nr:MBL fold metallo-hydrolase [Anaerolineales bacterium]